jgi:hypothetical protein
MPEHKLDDVAWVLEADAALTVDQNDEAARLALQLASQLPRNIALSRQTIRHLAMLQSGYLETVSRPTVLHVQARGSS